MTNNHKLLTVQDVCDKLGCRAASTVYEHVNAGRLPPPIRLGGMSRWIEAEIDAAIERSVEERDARLGRSTPEPDAAA